MRKVARSVSDAVFIIEEASLTPVDVEGYTSAAHGWDTALGSGRWTLGVSRCGKMLNAPDGRVGVVHLEPGSPPIAFHATSLGPQRSEQWLKLTASGGDGALVAMTAAPGSAVTAFPAMCLSYAEAGLRLFVSPRRWPFRVLSFSVMMADECGNSLGDILWATAGSGWALGVGELVRGKVMRQNALGGPGGCRFSSPSQLVFEHLSPDGHTYFRQFPILKLRLYLGPGRIVELGVRPEEGRTVSVPGCQFTYVGMTEDRVSPRSGPAVGDGQPDMELRLTPTEAQ